MRSIGQVSDEQLARVFGDYLYAQGIENQIEPQGRDGWMVWILDEDKLGNAEQLLGDFKRNPTDPKYQGERKAATERRAQAEEDQKAYQKRVRGRRHLFRPLTGYSFGPLTFVLIAASVAVCFLSRLGENSDAVMGLFITRFDVTGDIIRWLPGLEEIRHGQVWRLITPIFIHFGVMHIFFNMWCLRDLGSMIEGRQSTLLFALLVLVFAAGSNFAQYLYGGPSFGGMSGVLYGLLGYIWIRGKCDPGSGLFLHEGTVTMMLIWFVMCFTGILGSVANLAHAAGLAMGMGWGYLSSLRYR